VPVAMAGTNQPDTSGLFGSCSFSEKLQDGNNTENITQPFFIFHYYPLQYLHK
jgi:hypothetical protein